MGSVTRLSPRLRYYPVVRLLARPRFPLHLSAYRSAYPLAKGNRTRSPGVTPRSSIPCRPHTPWCDGWMSSAFAPIVRARPCPIFGRPVRPGVAASATARYFSSCLSDSASRRTPCPPKQYQRWLQVRLNWVRLSPACPFRLLHTFACCGRRGITPAFGYDAPHLSAGGTSTLLIWTLSSTHYAALRRPGLLRAGLRFPSPSPYRCPAACSWPSRPCDRYGRTLESGLRVSMAPVLRRRRGRGLPGYRAVLRPRAEVIHPAGCVVAITLSKTLTPPTLLPSSLRAPWTLRLCTVSRPLSLGPLARAPTLRLLRCRTRRKAHFRPAGLSFGRAGFAPAGRRTGFHAIRVPSRPALPGRFSKV